MLRRFDPESIDSYFAFRAEIIGRERISHQLDARACVAGCSLALLAVW